jgi:hypothetical protein
MGGVALFESKAFDCVDNTTNDTGAYDLIREDILQETS